MTISPLPLAVEEVTPDWLTEALRERTPGVTVRGAQIVDIKHGTNTKIRLRLDLDEAGKAAGIPELVIVKGGFEQHSRRHELEKMYEKEVRGYNEFVGALGLPSPRCFFAGYDAGLMQGVIVLEDLVARGVTFCHASVPQTHEQVALRLTALARYHAQTWNSPELAPGGKWAHVDDFLTNMDPFFRENTTPETWGRFVGQPRGAAASNRFHGRDWMIDAWAKMRRFSDALPQCVVHGDTHLGNLYIDAHGNPGFFDSLASRAAGMMEISYHVSAAMDVVDRRLSERALVQHYLDELDRAGAPAPGFADAMHQYGVFLVYAHFIWMTTESHYQPEAVNVANCARVSAAMLDHDTLRLVAALA